MLGEIFWASIVGAVLAGVFFTIWHVSTSLSVKPYNGIGASIFTMLSLGANWYAVQRFLIEAGPASEQMQDFLQGVAVLITVCFVVGIMRFVYLALAERVGNMPEAHR